MAVNIINTGRARVVINVNDDSFVNLIGEVGTTITSAFLTETSDIVQKLGNTAERTQGYIEENSIENWVGRLTNAAFVQGSGGVTYANPDAFTGGSADWYAAQNYLLYGGNLLIGSTGSAFSDRELACIFHCPSDPSGTGGATAVENAVTERNFNTVGILYTGGANGTAIAGSDSALKTIGGDSAEYGKVIFKTHGLKRHLNYKRNNQLETSSGFRETPVTPDVAGCFVRTDRDFAPFYSPAGLTRGRILDVVSLVHNPTATEQDTLYEKGINPVVTFPGEGTFLFGDRSQINASSTFSRINIGRLFIFMKKTIGRLARQTLFEFNDASTRTNFKLQASTILRGIQANRGLTDFRIICDESNNPPEAIDANVFNADILIKPTKSINFITLTFTNKNEADDLGGQPSQETGT